MIPLLVLHYAMIPYVRITRLSAIQKTAPEKHWSVLLGFHALAVDGAAALSVVVTAFIGAKLTGSTLLLIGGLGAALCGGIGMLGAAWKREQLAGGRR